MLKILFSQDIQPLSAFRANAAAFIEQIHTTKRPIVLTHHGKSSAILMDVKEYEKLLEKLELMQDLYVAERELKQGKSISHAEVKKQIQKKLQKRDVE